MEENLLEILRETLVFLKKSKHDSVWSAMTVSEITKVIENEIENIMNNHTVNIDELELQFLPTSFIQDTAMQNGWSDEYLKLAAKFDRALERYK